MKIPLKAIFVFLTIFNLVPQAIGSENWEEIKGKHFVVYFYPLKNREAANTVLRRAEDYYQKIGSQIGYTRYHDFWTWNERVKVIMFPDQQSFVGRTGQPAWAGGYTPRDSYVFKSRTIVTYLQESNFYDELLPHEISHLILRDFMESPINLPLWFEEGVAQLQEASKSEIAHRICQAMVRQQRHIPLADLMGLDIRQERDPDKVKAFYAQSLSVVEFLLKKYGSAAFGDLCRNLKNGKTFEEALRGAYTNNINTIESLESKWIAASQ